MHYLRIFIIIRVILGYFFKNMNDFILNYLKNAICEIYCYIQNHKNHFSHCKEIQQPAAHHKKHKIDSDITAVPADAYKENRHRRSHPENHILQGDRKPAKLKNSAPEPKNIIVNTHAHSHKQRLQQGDKIGDMRIFHLTAFLFCNFSTNHRKSLPKNPRRCGSMSA